MCRSSKYKFLTGFILFLILAVVFGVMLFWSELLDFYSRLTLRLPQYWAAEKIELVKETERKILTTEPLRAEKEDPESFLTAAGVLEWTNSHREKHNLPLLEENLKLNISAAIKTENMLTEQYFDHISPSGEEVDNLADAAGYQFVIIGENLALGDFQNDQALVQGWMDSPGHRENILNPQYQEIGIAVLRGEFAGRITWLAVQHFALPLSACPQPSEEILVEIEENRIKLKDMEEILKESESEIKKTRPRWSAAHGEKVEKYNNLVSEYNDLISLTQALISRYNNQINSFNECVAGG